MRGRTLKIKSVVLVLIFSMALTMLGACGSDAEEAAPDVENNEISESASVEENVESEEPEADTGIEDTEYIEDIEDIEADSISEEHPEEEEIQENRVSVTGEGSLVDIAWEDYSNEETTIYFSFSDGTIVDQKLMEWSIVKSIEFRDITSDGTDEVIIYSEYLNNIHDDYIIMNFFKIGDNTVTEISPSTDIPEVSVWWETEIASDPSEEYTIVLRMETYGKTAGALYTDTIVTVGYNKERWEIIQKQEIPEWKVAYLDYVIRDIVDKGSNRYWLVCVDEDDIPEMLYCVDDAQDTVSVLTYKDGEVKELGDEERTGEYENGMDFDKLWGILGSPEDDKKEW